MPKLDRDSVELRDVFDPFSLDFERDVDGEAPVVEDGLALDLSPYLSPGCRRGCRAVERLVRRGAGVFGLSAARPYSTR